MAENHHEIRQHEFENNKSEMESAAEELRSVLKMPSKDVVTVVQKLDTWLNFQKKLQTVESRGRASHSDIPLVRQRILDEIAAHIPQEIPKVDGSGKELTLEQRLQLAKEKGPPISIDQVLGSLIDEIENPFRARLDAATGQIQLIEPGLRYQMSKFPPFNKMTQAEKTQYSEIAERFRIAMRASDYLRTMTSNTDRTVDDLDREVQRAKNMNFTPIATGPQPPKHATP